MPDPILYIAIALGAVLVGVLLARYLTPTKDTPPPPNEKELARLDRLNAMSERVESALDAARSAEKGVERVGDDLTRRSQSLSGHITKLKQRVSQLEALTQGLALSGMFVADDGDHEEAPPAPMPRRNGVTLDDISYALDGEDD